MKQFRLLTLLALLLTAATGAWATDVYVVGNGTGNWLNGVAWDPGVAGNKMTEQNGVYSITFTNVDANSELQFKFAINGSWDVNYGCTSTDANELNKTLSNIDATGGMNFLFGLTEKADVTISFNLSEMTYMISTKGMKVGDDAASAPKHLITATNRERTRSLEQPLPYATTIGELFEAVTGEPFSDLISTMSSMEMPLTGISSNNTSAVSIGELNGASTPVTVIADGKATISINFGSYAYGIFVSAISPLYATMKDGVKDADKWTVKVGEGQAQALPIGGLKGDGSETVTLQYNGRLKVKGVKATSEAAAADNPAPTTASIEDYTAGTFGWDGDGSAATGLPTINTFAANDKISILSAKNTNTQFTTSAGGASATFSGTATDDSKFYAVYPYTAGLTLSGDVISGVVIPTSQWNSGWNSESNYSGWDPKAPIAYSTTTGSSLTFHNACAILKVTFSDAGMYGRFTISANEPLAGTFSLDTSTGTLTPTSGSTTVTVGTDSYYSSGICAFHSGKTVYVAIAPGTYTGFNLHLYNDINNDKPITKSGSVTFEAGKIYDLGSYDLFDFRRL